MKLLLKDSLPFITATIGYGGVTVDIDNVLIDTGSASTVFAIDRLAEVQLTPLPDDTLHIIRGVGGSEAVFSRRIDYLRVAGRSISDFEIEVGGMDYGFNINGILGMDFLTVAGAMIDLGELTLNVDDNDKLA